MNLVPTALGTIAFALAVYSGSASLNAGVIDILKGNPAEMKEQFQKVAFIGSAEIKEVEGKAERLVGIDEWKPIVGGEELTPGAVLRIGEGTVVLRMAETKSFVKVRPNTMLRLLPIEEGLESTLSSREERNGYVVRSCRGKAFARTQDGWSLVQVNSVLAPGTQVRTDPGAVLDLYSTQTKRTLRIDQAATLPLRESEFASRVLALPQFANASR